ncbi:NAD dependent epimerase/dehydratase family protein [Hyaloraphidium curvatum]|nr:NAD dependent epimerase/dehydratase family protein [Hyaloraphidium curvatum]
MSARSGSTRPEEGDGPAEERIFVSGTTGFVGRNLVAHLVRTRKPALLRALVRSEDGKRTCLEAGATEVVRGDLTGDPETLADALAGCDVVYHLAGFVGPYGSRDEFFRGNVDGTRALLEAAKRAGVRVFVFASSESVFVERLGKPVRMAAEDTQLPSSNAGPYGASKAEAEKLVLAADSPDFRCNVVRLPFVWGADDPTGLPRVLAAIRTGEFIWFGHAMGPFSHVHAANAAHGLVLCAERGRGGRIYHVTDGNPTPFRDFFSRMIEAAGAVPPPPYWSLPLWLASLLASGMDSIAYVTGWRMRLSSEVLALMGQEVSLDDSRTRREIGYAPMVSLEEGLEGIRRHYLAAEG